MPASERGTRKLAAIMFTDIKSFSKKMSENEELAMQILRVHDDTLKAIIEKYDGKIIKAIGDAFMVDFSSAVNAVKCAIESQEVFFVYNKGKTELEKIEVRIGIHLGDVITDGNDIFGDGVNIASRIEAVTEPNRICISHDVYSQIKNKMQVKTFHMGSINLKNIAEPVEVYEILLESIPEFSVPSKSAQQMPSKKQAEKVTKQEAKEAEHIEASKKKVEDDRLRVEKENQEKVQKFFQKAETLAGEGRLDDAEKELAEVFKIVAFHAGAQVLQGKIEEQREKKKEEDRKKGAARKMIEQRINELTTEALSMVEQNNFTEAVLKVREIFRIDPQNAGAKELEEQIRQAQVAKEELERQRSEADVALTPEAEGKPAAEEAPSATAQPPAEAVEEEVENEAGKAAAPRRRSVGLRRPKKHLPPVVRKLIVVGIVAALVVVFFPTLEKVLIPRDTSIVVAAFEVTGGSDTANIGAAIAGLISDDLSAYPELVVMRPGATPRTGRQPQPLALAKELQARYVLTGQIQSFYPKLVVRASLNVADVQATVWERTIESSP
ncbi:MAG TPA: adenylate/guanylate cyclase domain-containing protein, partial [Bacteroidota bacterium]